MSILAGMTKALHFTRDMVSWYPWIEPVEAESATPEQAELLAKITTNHRYFATLAHDPPALRERTALFNAIMYGHGGASRADRELAATATSRVNGCVYCASVHARLHAQLTRDETPIDRLLDEGIDADHAEHERVIIDYAAKLTRDPAGMTSADLAPLRAAGFTDAAILDINNAAAVFAWANRLMQSLGEGFVPVEGAG
jgi:uncharacterized peroxidase-related enzyme